MQCDRLYQSSTASCPVIVHNDIFRRSCGSMPRWHMVCTSRLSLAHGLFLFPCGHLHFRTDPSRMATAIQSVHAEYVCTLIRYLIGDFPKSKTMSDVPRMRDPLQAFFNSCLPITHSSADSTMMMLRSEGSSEPSTSPTKKGLQ